jgi:hypothetical protein
MCTTMKTHFSHDIISGWDDLPTDATEEVRLEIAVKRTGATSSSGQYCILGDKDMFWHREMRRSRYRSSEMVSRSFRPPEMYGRDRRHYTVIVIKSDYFAHGNATWRYFIQRVRIPYGFITL